MKKKKTPKKQQTHRPTVLSFPIIKPCWEFTLSENSLLQIARLTTPPAKQSQTFQQSILSGCREPHPSIRTAGCCYSSASVRASLYAHRHPRALTSWLCFAPRAAGGTAELSPEGGGGGQMRSPSTDPISPSSHSPPHHHHHHHHTPFTPTPPSFSPPAFPRCLVTLAPVISPLPSVEEKKREGERERLQPTTNMSPEAPCLPACLPACPSCCSVQLWLSTRP